MFYNYNFEYIALVFFLFFLHCIDNKQRKIDDYVLTLPKGICIVLYICFWGLRGFIGTDYSWYYPYFNNLSNNLFYAFDDIERIEPAFVIYVYIFKSIWNDYHAFIFFSTCLNVLFMHVIFKRLLKKYYIFGYIVFVAFCANAEFNNLRNIRSILLFFISLESVVHRNWKIYFSLNTIGLLFHSTAIFYFPFYFIVNKNWKKIILPFVLIGFMLVVFKLNLCTEVIQFLGYKMGGVYETASILFTSNLEVTGFTLGAIVRFIMGLFLWLIYDKIDKPIYRIYVNLVICYLFCFSFFNEIPVFRLRFSLMFAFALCVTLPYIYTVIQSKYKNVYFIFIFISSLSQAIVNFQGALFRYDNLLWGIESYEKRLSLQE